MRGIMILRPAALSYLRQVDAQRRHELVLALLFSSHELGRPTRLFRLFVPLPSSKARLGSREVLSIRAHHSLLVQHVQTVTRLLLVPRATTITTTTTRATTTTQY